MKRMLGLAVWLLAAAPAGASFQGADAGTAAGQFLLLGADARAAAMGEAVRALAQDASALYWNPAGLASLDRREATFTHGAYYQSVFYDFMAYAQPVDSALGSKERFLRPSQVGTVGAAVLYLNAGQINEIDNTGTPTGATFTPQDLAVMAGWGSEITRDIDAGVTAKYISSRIEETAATGAVDLGARWRGRLGEWPYTAAAVVQNLGGRLKFIQEGDPLPLLLTLGNAVRPLRNWTLTLDVVAPKNHTPYVAAGTELLFPFDEGLSAVLRAGYQGRTSAGDLTGMTGLCAGGGLVFSRFAADYAWSPFGVLGDTHRFTLSYRF